MIQHRVQAYLSKLQGVIAFHKPHGIRSTQLCNQIKEDLYTKIGGLPGYMQNGRMIKMGHGGILDWSATGVLPVGFGAGCRYLRTLLDGEKKYRVVGMLGLATETYCEVGNVIDRKPYDHVTHAMLTESLDYFRGDIMQRPPVYSSLKHEGKRLSDMVRAGEPIPEYKVKPRPVSVSRLELIDFQPPHFTLEIDCGAGFYVRSLIHDLGYMLDSCAYVKELVRTQHGLFTLEDCINPCQYTPDEFLKQLKRETKKYQHIIKIQTYRLKEFDNYKRQKVKKWKSESSDKKNESESS